MSRKILNALVITLCLFYSCSNTRVEEKNKQTISEERIFPANSKSEKLFNQLRPKSQQFQISQDSDNIITGNMGTQVFIPKNSFVDTNNKIVAGNVDIELIEILSVADFVKTNLQTVSNGKPLQSDGMLFINAKVNGQSISVAEGKFLQVELPHINKLMQPSDIKIFSGKYDTSGSINWDESGKLQNRLISLPLDLFVYNRWTCFGFERVANNDGYIANDSDEVIDSITFKNKKLENTFIATREFEERFPYITSAEWAIGHYTSYYSTTVKKGKMISDSTISKIYLNNLDKDLFYCDSLAYNYMKSWEGKAKFYSYWYSEAEKVDLLAAFKNFYNQRLTRVISFPKDIDLEKEDAREKLSAKGFKELEIDEILGAYQRQHKIITVRKNKSETQNILANSFTISKIGWINCDQFYDDPIAKEASISANIKSGETYDFAALTLIINERRIALSGNLTGSAMYTFTGRSQPYTRLPIGEKATIIAISYKNNKPYLGIKETVISEKANYNIDLKESSTKEINDKLMLIN